jgi:hypothetical protein
MSNLSRPLGRDYESFLNFFYMETNLCEEEEKNFLFPREMVALVDYSDGSMLESFFSFLIKKFPFAEVSMNLHNIISLLC